MTIKILEKTVDCMPQVYEIGDWYDLKVAEDIHLKAPKANTLHRINQGKEDANDGSIQDRHPTVSSVPSVWAKKLQ